MNAAGDLLIHARRMLILFIIGWTLVLACEATQRAGLVDELQESVARTVVWLVVVSILVFSTWRSFPWRAVRYSVVVFAVCSLAGFVIGVSEDIRGLDGVPIIGHRGPLTHLAKKLLFAGWACSISYLFYQLLQSVDQSRKDLEARVEQRTDELRHANEELKQEIEGRQRVEEEMRALHAQLAHLNRLAVMGEMASALAHEVNQPMGAIVNLVNASHREFHQGQLRMSAALETLEEIRGQALRTSAIVHRVRSFVSRQTPSLSSVDINDLASEVAHLLEPEARQYGITVQLNLEESLPPVPIDRVRIQQVLVNVLRNAFEAMEEVVTGSREVTVRTETTTGYVLIEVADTGNAVPVEIVRHMFEPYFTTKTNGLGMGLSISRSIVEQHGGQVSTTADPRGGLRVRFTLPLA